MLQEIEQLENRNDTLTKSLTAMKTRRKIWNRKQRKYRLDHYAT